MILHDLFLSEVAVEEPGQPIRQGGLVPLILCGRCLRPRETGSGLTLRGVSRQIFDENQNSRRSHRIHLHFKRFLAELTNIAKNTDSMLVRP